MSDLLRLACQECHWIIPPELTLGLVKQHFATEHPDHVDDAGEPKIDMQLVACCLKCGDRMPLFATFDRGSHYEHHYHCERCARGYEVNEAKKDGGTD